MSSPTKKNWITIAISILTVIGLLCSIPSDFLNIWDHTNSSASEESGPSAKQPAIKLLDTTLTRPLALSIETSKPLYFTKYEFIQFDKDRLLITSQYKIINVARDTILNVPIAYINDIKIRKFDGSFTINYKNDILPSNRYAYLYGQFNFTALHLNIEALKTAGYDINIRYAGASVLMIVGIILFAFGFIVAVASGMSSEGCGGWVVLAIGFVCLVLVRCN